MKRRRTRDDERGDGSDVRGRGAFEDEDFAEERYQDDGPEGDPLEDDGDAPDEGEAREDAAPGAARPRRRGEPHDTAPPVDRALLLRVLEKRGPRPSEHPLDELARLAATAGAEVVGRMVQQRDRVSAHAYLGSGKVKEVASQVKALGANLVLVDDDLSPSQERHLGDETGTRVVDRSGLILDIFAQRARTTVARAQVELAQLEYMLPRLAHMWEHLSRLGGGIGTRGPGETQLEVDRRRVRERIARLKRTLEKAERDWRVQRKSAREVFSVALVGYTNSGKSTLMNALTGAGVGADDRLFETVDTTTRVWEPAPGARVLLSDTVGFIRRLPHDLIASFHATLGEVREADLLLHVVDASRPDHDEAVRVVEEVLGEIGAAEIPSILVANKIDALDDVPVLARSELARPGVVAISARTGAGLDELARVVLAERAGREVHAEVTVPFAASRALAALHEHGRVEERIHDDGGTRVIVRIAPDRLARIAAASAGVKWKPVRVRGRRPRGPG